MTSSRLTKQVPLPKALHSLPSESSESTVAGAPRFFHDGPAKLKFCSTSNGKAISWS